ncbi:MAG: DNA/RNA nuclease SfsA [Clostridia bacterium]|nr:DNA/RNA nuclease SfsA [Clostridia bacterium]
MKYKNIVKGVFISRPNRFIAICNINGKDEICHVKNTGRCRELLVFGATVYLEKSENPMRKTLYDLVAVEKNGNLFNIDSSAPNNVVFQWLNKGKLFEDFTLIRPEYKYGNSRFDFYVEHGDKKTFIEVKGVTLENNGVLMFPDAPTIRGIKHIKELEKAVKSGYEAYIIFVIQTKDALYFTPNYKTHPEFGEALKNARKNGVNIICVNCYITVDSLEINDYIDFKL